MQKKTHILSLICVSLIAIAITSQTQATTGTVNNFSCIADDSEQYMVITFDTDVTVNASIIINGTEYADVNISTSHVINISLSEQPVVATALYELLLNGSGSHVYYELGWDYSIPDTTVENTNDNDNDVDVDVDVDVNSTDTDTDIDNSTTTIDIDVSETETEIIDIDQDANASADADLDNTNTNENTNENENDNVAIADSSSSVQIYIMPYLPIWIVLGIAILVGIIALIFGRSDNANNNNIHIVSRV